VRFEHQQVLEVEHLLSGKRKKVHTTRVKFYRDASLELTEELISFVEYQDSILLVIEELIALRQLGENVQVQVKWLRFDDSESTWEQVSTNAADVPEMLKSFLNGQTCPLVDKVMIFLR
jgi:Chromo (CHRromatin Organisation MOdifier) domain